MLANLQGLSVKGVSSCSWGPAGAPACVCIRGLLSMWRQNVAKRQNTAEEECRPRGREEEMHKRKSTPEENENAHVPAASQCEFKTAYTYGICHTEHYFEQKFSYKNI